MEREVVTVSHEDRVIMEGISVAESTSYKETQLKVELQAKLQKGAHIKVEFE